VTAHGVPDLCAVPKMPNKSSCDDHKQTVPKVDYVDDGTVFVLMDSLSTAHGAHLFDNIGS
jgi:hypothetical protein